MGQSSAVFYVNTTAVESTACAPFCTSFTGRFSGNAGIEVDPREDETVTFTWTYEVTFDIDALAGEAWRLSFNTDLLGALTLVDDGSGSASATLNDVTGTYSGPGTLQGSLDLTGFGTLSGTNSADSPFDAGDRSARAVLPRAWGPASLTLTFTMTGEVHSESSAPPLPNAAEAAVRLGEPGNFGGFSAGNYPGVGARDLATDGHFLIVTLIPEPSPALLLGLSVLALAVVRRLRRR